MYAEQFLLVWPALFHLEIRSYHVPATVTLGYFDHHDTNFDSKEVEDLCWCCGCILVDEHNIAGLERGALAKQHRRLWFRRPLPVRTSQVCAMKDLELDGFWGSLGRTNARSPTANRSCRHLISSKGWRLSQERATRSMV